MNFVTKKEFEAAVLLIERAIKNGQVVSGYGTARMELLLFSDHTYGYDLLNSQQISFIPPTEAVKNSLFKVRRELYQQKDKANINQKSLESLEKEEKELAALLSTLKE